MTLKDIEDSIEFSREVDGRWICEYTIFPGCLAYGLTKEDAQKKAVPLVNAVLRERRAQKALSELQTFDLWKVELAKKPKRKRAPSHKRKIAKGSK